MSRNQLKLKVVASYSTEIRNETRWIFEDENKKRYEWYTTSGRILIKNEVYTLFSDVIIQLHGNFLYNPRRFKEVYE